ncbi:MAG: carbohydrate ABC transporter permease [Acidimicrobiales bacterium]|nr:carbohydrate ABC transporter permease [Acidimicrobiales bacterium]RZV46277.1 MAG: carbohydrate ABC transporter permease [Acidimicrobiales bacterium]
MNATLGARIYDRLRSMPMWALWGLVLLWTLPSLSLFLNSFRSRSDQQNAGFWTMGGNPGDLTLENYQEVLAGGGANDLSQSLISSFAIAIPATIIPIAFATFAAYGFAWIDFKGREWMFIATVSLLAIPLQVALIPLLQTYVGGAHFTPEIFGIGSDKTITLIPDLDLNTRGGIAVWLTHTGFAMPFSIFLLHNYISELPKEVFESARIDGASHFTIFWRLVLPLSIPALAAFAIFQFLWTWNDFLIAVTMLSGGNPVDLPTTVLVANLAGDFGRNEHLLPAGAFVQAFFPLVVFFSLQRFFVRGLLAGSVKG